MTVCGTGVEAHAAAHVNDQEVHTTAPIRDTGVPRQGPGREAVFKALPATSACSPAEHLWVRRWQRAGSPAERLALGLEG